MKINQHHADSRSTRRFPGSCIQNLQRSAPGTIYEVRNTTTPPLEWETAPLDGIRLLTTAPVTDIRIGSPPKSREEPSRDRYLWVIDHRGIPYILEAPYHFQDPDKLPKHTNITEGAVAYVGGELWFSSNVSLFLSGGSGRYHPIDEHQLDDAAKVFENYGYQVISLGWDTESGYAARELAN